MFEPDSKATDSLSYDLTAWALPYVYNLKAFAVTDRIAADTGKVEIKKIINETGSAKPYAYVVNFSGFDELKFMAALYKKEYQAQIFIETICLERKQFQQGKHNCCPWRQ